MRPALSLLLLIAAAPGIAQTTHIGIKGGPGLGQAGGRDFRGERGGKAVMSAGFSYDRLSRSGLFLGAELLYQHRGFSSDMTVTDINGQDIRIKRFLSYRYNYIVLPVRVGIRRGDKIFGFASVALVPGMLFLATTRSITTAAPSGTIPGTSRLDLSGQLEAGAGCRLSERYSLSASLGYQRSFSTVPTPWNTIASTARPVLFTGSVGLQYELPRARKTGRSDAPEE